MRQITDTMFAEAAAEQEQYLAKSQMHSGQEGIPKSWFTDPFALLDSLGLGYKSSPSGLSYETLRQMAANSVVVSAIIQTRVHQVASFTMPQQNKYSIGYRITHKDRDRKLTEGEINFVKDTEKFLSRCGADKNDDRDDLETYVKKIVRDRLTYDQMCTEIVYKYSGKPHSFFAIPGSTIRLAAPKKRKGTPLKPGETKTNAKYVQVVDGVLVNQYTVDQLGFSVANPRTDLRAWGYGYCLHPDSRVMTTSGMIRVEDLSDNEFSIILDGKTHRATAFSTGEKQVHLLCLADGRELKASKDHRLYCVDEDTGEWVWKRLGDVKVGDFIATDVSGSESGTGLGSFSYTPEPRQRSKAWAIEDVGEDLCEVLGWLVGDGSLTIKTGRFQGKAVSLAYAEGEEEIAERHRAVLASYNLPSPLYVTRDDGLCGEIKFNHEGFGRWLLECVGYVRNEIPEAIFHLPLGQRCAFLRGLFSADGHVGNSDIPVLGCTKKVLLQGVQRLLLSIGIRSRWTHKRILKDLGYGEKLYDDGRLHVYDKEVFFERVGFLQDHKSPILENCRGTRADVVSPAFARRAANDIKKSGKGDRRTRGLLEDPPRWGVTRGWLEQRLSKSWAGDLKWSQTKVVAVTATSEHVEMYDVSVDSDFHGFTVDGIVVHNSELEMLIKTVTSHLWAEEWNRKAFSQGSTTKGILNLKGNIPPQQLDAFKRQWLTQVSGVSNAWRTPVINSNEDIQWIDLQPTNTEMGYMEWMNYLIKIACAIYLIDPAEINFDIRAGTAQPMFMTTNEAQQKVSQDRGLRPLLRHVQNNVNKHVVYRIDDDYEFEYVGIDAKSEDQAIELRTKELSSYKTLNEVREAEQLPPVEDGDIVPNPSYIGWRNSKMQMEMQQQQMSAQPGGAEMPGGMPGGGVPGFGGAEDDGEPGDEEKSAQQSVEQELEGKGKKKRPKLKADRHRPPPRLEPWENTITASVDNDLQKAVGIFDEFFTDL